MTQSQNERYTWNTLVSSSQSSFCFQLEDREYFWSLQLATAAMFQELSLRGMYVLD